MRLRQLVLCLLLTVTAVLSGWWLLQTRVAPPAPQPAHFPVAAPILVPQSNSSRWGGALNSAAADGSGFFNRKLAREFTASVASQERKYVVELHARSFLPHATADEVDTLLPEGAAPIVYLQFHDHPTPAQREQLAAQRIELLQYVAGYAWAARAPRADWKAAFALPYVRAFATIDARDKLHAQVFRGDTPGYARTDDGQARFSLLAYPGTALNTLVKQLPQAQVLSGHASVLGPRFEIIANAADAVALAALPQTAFVEFTAPPVVSRDAVTDDSSNITDVRDNAPNVNGSGVKVAVRELGEPDAHVDYNGRLQMIDTNGRTDLGNVNHATAVAGQIGGNGSVQPTAKGVAPAVNMLYYAVADQSSSFFTTDIIDGASRGARLSNHSYGPVGLTQWGDYQTISADWDAAIRSNNLLAFFAGNEETGNLFKHIDFFVGMKNGICVGASSATAHAGDDNPAAAKTNGNASFSEFGPMNDGRVKPDLVAFGQSVTLLRGNNGISTASGTSFSTPAVSGVGALVFQHYKSVAGTEPSAALAKAILCNSASDLGNPGPDAANGFGIVNAEEAIRTISLRTSITNSPFFEGSLTNGKTSTFTVNVSAGATFKATLCWLDVAGTPGAAKALVNDLDLELESPTGAISYPFSLNPGDPSLAATSTGPNSVDPIEQTVVTNAAAGTWTVRIKGTSIPQGDQGFAVCLNLPKEPTAVTATLIASPTTGAAPLTVGFSGTLSTGQITTYMWTFGDGATGSGSEIEHTYTAPGTYTATLTVMDNLQRQSSSSLVIIVSKKQARAFGAKAAAALNFTKSASDKLSMTILAEDLAMPPQAAKDALRDGKFEGKTYAVRIGGETVASGIADRKASFSTFTTKFKINPAKGEIKVSISNQDLAEIFSEFGMTNDAGSTGLHTLPVEIETEEAIYAGSFLFIYSANGKAGKGKSL